MLACSSLRLIFGWLLVLGACAAPSRAEEVVLFAAASLAPALTESLPTFERSSGHAVKVNFAATGALLRQLREGAPADVFFSADRARMEEALKGGLVVENTQRVLLTNTLVLVAARDEALVDEQTLLGAQVRRVALGDPALVPAGSYAKRHLVKSGLWDALQPKLLPVESVRAALAAVESGSAQAAYVYASDAHGSSKVRVVAQAGDEVVSYPAAVVTAARHPEAARALLAWLAGAEAEKVFLRHGFKPATSPGAEGH